MQRWTLQHAWNGTGAMVKFEHGEFVTLADATERERELLAQSEHKSQLLTEANHRIEELLRIIDRMKQERRL